MIASLTQSYHTRISPLRFFALTFALSWLVWIPLALSHFGIAFNIAESTSSVVRLLGVLMPAVSALVLAALSGEKCAVRNLLKRLTVWRVGWRWWGVSALVYPLILIAAALVYNLFGSPRVIFVPQDIAALVINSIFLLIAVLGEEIGWHGIALPALQQKHSARVSSIILGSCWGFWHLPFWLLLDTFDWYGFQYLALNLAFVLPLTFYATWFFNHSRYSLLLPVVFHLTFNIVNTALLPVTLSLGAFAILIAFTVFIMLLVSPRLEP